MSRIIPRCAGLLVVGLTLAIPQALPGQEEQEVEDYQIGTALPPMDPGGTLVEMTLDQAIARALEMNLDIQTARLDPEIEAYSLEVAQAAFSPTFSSTYSFNDATRQSTSQLDGGIQTSTERQSLNASLTKPLPWYGSRLSADFNNGRTATDNSFSTRNPSYSSTLSLNFTQPLLSGRSTDNQRTALKTSELQGQIADINLTSQVENIVNQVRVAYWNLRALIEAIEIQRRALALAEQLLENNRIRVRLGTMSGLQVVQAEAQVASAEQALLNAEIQWRNQELNLKRLLVNGPDDPLLQETVNPVDLPSLEEQIVDIEAALSRALEGRTDIRRQRQQRQISELNIAVTRDNLKPQLNLSAGYSLQGVGGDLYTRSGLGGEPELLEESGYLDGLGSIWDRDTPTWNLSLNFSYPIGNQAAKASLERSQLQLLQNDLAIRSQELTIVTQVTDAGLTVRDTFLQVQAAQRSREVAERQYEVELARFNAGASTNYEVVTAQDNMTSARLSELQAIIRYVNAVADFERVQRVGG